MDFSGLSDISVEPSTLRRLTGEQKDRLTDVLDKYLSALDRAVPPRRESLFQEHPDLAEALKVYLDQLDELHGVAAGFGDAARRSANEASPADGDERRLGDFVLGREVGRGGMGVVYEARQISLGRRVALKVLPFAAVLDFKQIARFKNEAHAAAQLHHPNIVPVFAIGAERGVHYYAMQFIDGQPLDRAIAELRSRGAGRREPSSCSPAAAKEVGRPTNLAPQADDESPAQDAWPTCRSLLTEKSGSRQQFFRSVVRLGIQAAEALHAAHEYGVVHRDVKPSNLLLDGEGKLWVTDFGLARCQSNATLTKTGDLVGTMRYMSPEQAAGQSALVDHRTDVYSLGVTLYELLTLRPAFPGDEGPGLLRQIEQQEPPSLRACQPHLPADLETVILKAMAKRRDDRYATAQEFADDLRCVLEGKPTLAKPPTVSDRLNKWARRHRRFVGAVAAACLVAMAGLAASTFLIGREKVRAERNYERAERNFRQARANVDHFGARLAERLADIPGAEEVRRELLQDTLQYYQGFIQQTGNDPALGAELALTYSKIGTITGEIGSTGEAIAAHQNAVRILERLAAAAPHMAEHRRHLATSLNNLALLLGRIGATDEASRAYREASRLQEQLVAEAPDDERYQGDLALSHSNLGLLQSQTGEADKAEASFREAIRVQQDLVATFPDDPERLRSLAAAYNNLGAIYDGEQPAKAAEYYETALRYQGRAMTARPAVAEYQSDVALTYNNLGAAQSRAQQYPEATASYGRAIEIQDELVRTVPAQTSYRRDLAVSLNNLGMLQSELRQKDAAEGSFRQALEIQDPLVSQYPQDVNLQSSLGGIYNNLGIVLEELNRVAEAAEAYQRAVVHQQAAFAHAPTVARYRTFLSKHYFNYGRVLRQLGNPDEAARVALARKELWPKDPQRLFTVAEELALASKLNAQTSQANATAERCATLAIATLREAAAAGLKVPADLGWNEAFAALQDRAEFAELVKH